MKEFKHNPLKTDPLDVARRDYLEFCRRNSDDGGDQKGEIS
jgi:hypothetical protein